MRVQGRFQAACVAYRRSLPFWRTLELEAEHADTLNNLAWANAEIGNFARARRYCRDGLNLREELGSRHLIALSLNTLGLIEIKDDKPHRGEVHCKRALAIFRDIGMPRGVGLACTALAEAYRRSAATPEVYTPHEQAERLSLAEDFADQAVQTFRHTVQERLRLVEALNELGCVYRDWARIRPEDDSAQAPDRNVLAEKGIRALREAAQLSADEFLYRQVDALTNLAWLYSYIERSDKAKSVLCEAESLVPADYHITSERGVPQLDDPSAFFWVQMGKAHLLRGWMAVQEYGATRPAAKGEVRDESLLWQVTEHFTLALAYDELFGEDFRDLRRAKDSMYRALQGINVNELRMLYKGVEAVAREYRLESRPAEGRQPSHPRFRNFLNEYFGSPEDYEAITA
jgi:tetratricopeptide (TPR) repeat protein